MTIQVLFSKTLTKKEFKNVYRIEKNDNKIKICFYNYQNMNSEYSYRACFEYNKKEIIKINIIEI